jgi:hypothetical protein
MIEQYVLNKTKMVLFIEFFFLQSKRGLGHTSRKEEYGGLPETAETC